MIKVTVNGIVYLAHNWAEYVAMDKDGVVWEYEYEPSQRSTCWVRFGCRYGTIKPEYSNWKNSLIKINKEEK